MKDGTSTGQNGDEAQISYNGSGFPTSTGAGGDAGLHYIHV